MFPPEAAPSSYTVNVGLSPSKLVSNDFNGHWMRSHWTGPSMK